MRNLNESAPLSHTASLSVQIFENTVELAFERNSILATIFLKQQKTKYIHLNEC